MSKAWKITVIIISILFLCIFAFLGVYYLWPWNKAFFDKATQEFVIPGLDTKFVPQGFDKIDGSEKYIISGYMSDNSPSRYYIIDENGGVEKYFTLTSSGEDYVGHAGGVASSGSTLWTVGDKMLYRFMLSDINKVENGGKVEIISTKQLSNGADCVFIYDKYLWIGEFYKEKDYETSQTHRLETRTGEINPSLVYGYRINESMSNGLYEDSPSKLLSIRGECQGIAVTADGKFVMSTSYGLKDSTLYYYNNVLDEERHDTFVLGKKMTDLWYLDGESLISEVNAPAMSEELVIKNNRVYILFESACQKYKLFNRKQLNNVYSLDLSVFDNQKSAN